jgi:class 3 adenylate cyclase/predicted ATPase
MQQIADWLKKLGMSEYAELFAENRIDFSVLRDLTDQDLKDLGVALGDRRKMLRAIGEFSAASLAAPAMTTEPVSPDAAERRQVTVMFSDLVGSTALSARMDPEDLREVISTYQKRVAETVQRFGGFVAKYMGDGVLVYFGYPQAHEDDAERAVRAGLELIAAVSALKAPVSLQTRVGIATGLVVVGDLIGSGEARERGIVGETPNLAARLQGIAEPNTVVIAEGTRRLLGSLFELDDLASRDLKGIPGSVRAWTALRASSVESRFEAQHETKLTPLVGRDEELELLLRRWRQAVGGEGRVVLLSGEPGIGKSRLIVALDEQLQTEQHTPLRYFCSPLHTDSTLYPFISQLERAAGFERNDTIEAKHDKLSSLLGASPNHDNDVQILAELLSVPIPTGDRYPPLNLGARQKKQKTIEALVRQLEVLVRQRPVLMIFEDAHWIDPSSRELLDTIIERVARLPVLLVITFRPEFHPPWTGQAHVSTLNLSRLGRREGAALAGSVAGNNVLPEEIVEEIIERTDGIPLFVEELTKAVVEARVRDGDVASTLNRVPHSALAIPATLHASLMARLDRLGAVAREVAQIGAAIGREFSYEVLAPIAQKTDMEVQTALSRLTDAELVFCRGTPPQATFLFKHALVRDVAYGSLLRGQRQQLHGRIASILEAQFPDVVESRPELLGHHFSQGGFEEKAIVYWTLAGERAVKRDANAEAIRHFGRALELLEGPPETAERRKAELTILAKLGPALQAARGFAAPEVETTYLRARELCEQLGEPHELFQALWGLWLNSIGRERWNMARPIADELLTLAQRLDDRALLLEAHHAMCPTTLWVGDPQLARTHGEQGMALYDREQHQSLAFLFGNHDPGVCCRMHSAIALWFLGYSQKAVERSRTGIAMARELSHIGTLVNELPFAGIIHQLRREAPAVRKIAESLIDLSTEHGFPQWLAFGKVLDSWAQAEQVDDVGLVAQLRHAIGEYRDKNELYVPYFLVLLAATQLRYAESAEGLDTVVGALAMNEKRGSRLMDPELYRLKGELLLASDPSVEPDAEVAFRNAIDTARRQSTKSWELRAATSLARLLRYQGKRDEARRTIAEVYEWFTEGFDTLDLKEAKALLHELHS